MRCMWSLPAALGIILCSAGCNSGPTPPQPGTPEFLWSVARTNYAAGDYVKAADNLTQLAKGTSEFAVRSRPLAILLSSGIAKAYVDLADSFEAGGKANRENPTPFIRKVNLFRGQASSASMQTAEAVHQFFQSNPPDSIPLDLAYPRGSAAEPVSLQRVAKGMMLPDAETDALQKEMIERSVLFAVTRGRSGRQHRQIPRNSQGRQCGAGETHVRSGDCQGDAGPGRPVLAQKTR